MIRRLLLATTMALAPLAAGTLSPLGAFAQTAPMPLRAVGHFSANTKTVEIERAFYDQLPAATGMNLAISFNPMDQIGLQAADGLRHLRSGAFDVMAILIGQVSRDEPFFDGLDIIGVSTTIADLRKAVDAGREALDKRLQERFGAHALAIWPFGPQYFFCNSPVRGVADLRGLKVRSYTPSMSALLQSFGAIPVTLQFSEVYPALQRGLVACGITSAVSAYTGNWGEVTTHVLPLSLAGGIQGHFMSQTAWRRLSPEQQVAMTTAFKTLEQRMWDFAQTSDTESLACLAGKPECPGRKFTALIAAVPPEDDLRMRDAVTTVVLPSFRDSCNRVWAECAAVWNRTVGAARGYTIQ
ncbi:MAG: transporter substrate-binding protein [Belnapia sp.]|nr:transporter substrate-binding protein [Belnapia sp.]